MIKAGKPKDFHGLAIDSREVKKNNLFLTIKGKNNDGKDFIPAALKKGAVQIISSKKMKRWKKKTLSVNNEIELLNNFALKKRNSSSAQILQLQAVQVKHH